MWGEVLVAVGQLEPTRSPGGQQERAYSAIVHSFGHACYPVVEWKLLASQVAEALEGSCPSEAGRNWGLVGIMNSD